MSNKHTPKPWKVGYSDGSGSIYITGHNDKKCL